MKKIFILSVIICFFASCGDSYSIYTFSIDNKTEYNIILYFDKQIFTNSDTDSILCIPHSETIIFEMSGRSIKKLACSPCPSSDYINVVVGTNEKHLIKGFSDINNWECSGATSWSLIMVGNYYSNIKSTL